MDWISGRSILMRIMKEKNSWSPIPTWENHLRFFSWWKYLGFQWFGRKGPGGFEVRWNQSTQKLKPPVNQKTEEYFKKELQRVNAELENYPAPIAGCDVQFNHLLEKRTELERRFRLKEPDEKLKILKGGNPYWSFRFSTVNEGACFVQSHYVKHPKRPHRFQA